MRVTIEALRSGASKNADDLGARMKKTYPNLGMENLVNNGATAAFQPARGR